ncbi:MAG: response regulator [Bacteroidetes bacterium]|nr:response regulator [Bacteroidota bacterium]
MSNLQSTPYSRVILCDDDEDEALIFKMALGEKLPLDLIYIQESLELLRYLANPENKPDLIFLDVSIPRVNGIECLTFIRTMQHLDDVPVVMISTNTTSDMIDTALQKGANYYIGKASTANDYKADLETVFGYSREQLLHLTPGSSLPKAS